MGETSALISAAELSRVLNGTSPPALLDVRWSLTGPPGRGAYLAGHIPGAAFVDLDRDLAAPPGNEGRHPLPSPEHFNAAMRRAGLSASRGVVVYDQRDAMAAARAWWLLLHYGHHDVRVLDGGFDAWTAAGGAVATGDEAIAAGDFEGTPGTLPVVDAAGAATTAANGLLIDARAAARFRGEVEPVDAVAGHIPGAINLPTAENVDEQGRFLDAAALRARFHAAGVHGDKEIAAYCGSGVTAAHEILALNLAGMGAALYPGSWSGWITDPSRPIGR